MPLSVVSLDGATVTSVPDAPRVADLRAAVTKACARDGFDLVFRGQVLEDPDVVLEDPEPVFIIWRPRRILTASGQSVALFQEGQLLYRRTFPTLVSACLSPTRAHWLASSSSAISVHDTETGEEVLRVPQRPGQKAIFSRDGSEICVYSFQGARLYRTCGSGAETVDFAQVRFGVFGPNRQLLLVSVDGFATLFSDSKRVEMAEAGKWCRSVSFFSKEDSALAALRDGTARIFCLRSGSYLRVFRESGWVSDAYVAPDDSKVLLVLSDCTARLYQMAKGQVVGKLSLENLGAYIPPFPVAFSQDGRRILFCLDSCNVKVVDADSGDLVSLCQGGRHHITSAGFSPDALQVVVSYYEPSAKVFCAASGQCVQELDHSDVVSLAAFA